MAETSRKVKFVFTVPLQDAGEATRSLEIARGLREHCPPGHVAQIEYLAHGGAFAEKVRAAGFAIHDVEPIFKRRDWKEDLQTKFPEFFGDPAVVAALIKGEKDALAQLAPDFVVHGFWPTAAIARRALGIPAICFLPMPLNRESIGSLLKDVPDALKPLCWLPRPLRRALIRALPAAVKAKSPAFRQRNIQKGAEACGIRVGDLFEMLAADLTVVNDLPDFYADVPMPKTFRVVGPLFASADPGAKVDPEILRVFDPAQKAPRIYCAMGTSGTKAQLLEAVKALVAGADEDGWRSVILASPAVCPLSEALALAGGRPNVYVTDAFVPAPLVNAMADVTVSHGGHGTVQTALASGTPIVGVAMQPEQQINLDNVVGAGAAFRIPAWQWRAAAIRSTVREVLADARYRASAQRLKKSLEATDGRKGAAAAIWEFADRALAARPPDRAGAVA